MMKIRTDLIKYIIETKKPKSYLEIGIQRGENFDQVNVPNKVGVEPFPTRTQEGVLTMFSDQFFKDNTQTFDLIFIDGDHSYEQTAKDLKNALEVLNEGGVIVMHDALPHNLEYTSMLWCGTSYKAIMEAAQDIQLIVKTWDQDHGCAVIVKETRTMVDTDDVKFPTTEFEDLWANDAKLVGKSTTEEIKAYIKTL